MEHTLEARGLSPPEPLEHILDALADMADTDHLHVLLERDPLPLYSMLSTMGYRWRREAVGGHFEVYIWRADREPPAQTGA
ncbi:MAG: DUF2249 domain-containing protein [Gammaproteobacteria bacterium]|nr:DUF2249 domain-containing protein [Gammaproteobacteria bacterium]